MRTCILQSWTHQCIFVRSAGVVSGDDWCEMIHHLMSTECYELGMPVLHDMRFADFSTTSEDMLKPGRLSVRPTGDGPPGAGAVRKVAMVASDMLGFGLMGVVARLRERAHHKPRGFLDMAEATAWVNHPEFGDRFPDDAETLVEDCLASQPCRVTMLKSGRPPDVTVAGSLAALKEPAGT